MCGYLFSDDETSRAERTGRLLGVLQCIMSMAESPHYRIRWKGRVYISISKGVNESLGNGAFNVF